jgi:hypothetical protein
MMKIARLLCALWVCGPLALEARAADSPARNDGAVAPAKAGHPAAHESTQAGSSKGDGPKGRNAAAAASPRGSSVTASRAAGPLSRSNADRLRSLQPAKARGNTASTSNRRGAPKAATASSNLSARGIPGERLQALPTRRPVVVGVARVSPSAKAMVRGSAIGGPRAAAGPGQLGGPATGRRTVHNTAIDGTQVRHKT